MVSNAQLTVYDPASSGFSRPDVTGERRSVRFGETTARRVLTVLPLPPNMIKLNGSLVLFCFVFFVFIRRFINHYKARFRRRSFHEPNLIH